MEGRAAAERVVGRGPVPPDSAARPHLERAQWMPLLPGANAAERSQALAAVAPAGQIFPRTGGDARLRARRRAIVAAWAT